MPEQRLAFGPFVLNPEAGTLLRQGLPVAISYRGLLLLSAMARNAGEVLTKSQLLNAAWPGSAVEESNLSVQVASLRRLLGSMADGTEWIATVPRVGYRFTGAIERLDEAAAARNSAEPEPSIAVLPFVNLSDDAEQQYFADGLAEDIIMRLARLRWLFVCARNSSFSYRDKAIDVKQVGRELGVRYVLGGSVRRSGQRLRISAEASDTSTGRQLWTERYDVQLADFFTLQDQIADSVIGAVEPKLYAAEHQRYTSRPPTSLDAWGFVMKAMPHIWSWSSESELAVAEQLLRRAVDADPDYPRANSLFAWTMASRALLGLAEPAEVLPKANEMAQRAIAHDAEDPWTHFAAGYVHVMARRSEEAVAALTNAITLNPNLAIAHVILGAAYGFGGMPEDGLHHLAMAERLSPRDSAQQPGILTVAGLCHFVAQRFLDAASFEHRAVQLRPHFGAAWRTLAAAAGMAGNLEEATHALSEAKRLHPTLSVQWVEKYYPMVREQDRAAYIDGLRTAGLE